MVDLVRVTFIDSMVCPRPAMPSAFVAGQPRG
jgi:hypothetical protein